MENEALLQAARATREITEHRVMIDRLRVERLEAMRLAVADGASYADLARELGISLARVNQLLGSQYLRPHASGTPSAGVKGGDAPRGRARKVVKPREPEEHRHRFTSTGWNHRRGGFLLAQRCECGETRVVPAGYLPAELRDMPPVTSIVA